MIVAGTKIAARGEAGRDHFSEMFLRRRTMFCDSMEVSREKERCQEASTTGRLVLPFTEMEEAMEWWV